MSFDRFVHLLATETLWLAPLSSMEDKREGEWVNVRAPKFRDQVQRHFDDTASQTVVSSWVAAPNELLHMWNSYAPPDTGIAVSTDVSSLLRALAGKSLRDDAFCLMQVIYSDDPAPVTVDIPGSFDPTSAARHKSRDFEHENEVRVVYARSTLEAVAEVGIPKPAAPGKGTHHPIKKLGELRVGPAGEVVEIWALKSAKAGEGTHTCTPLPPIPGAPAGVILDELVPPPSGTYIKIQVIADLLRHGVFVSPRANPWMIQTARSVMQAYGHDCSLVQPSSLTPNFETVNTPPFQHNITYE